MRPTLIIALLLTTACSDSDIKSRDIGSAELEATVQVGIDAGTKRVQVSGSLQSAEFAQPPGVTFPDMEDPNVTLGRIRLVDGDAFWLDWEGRSHRLFRRERDFIYETDFHLPESRDFNARLSFITDDIASMQLAVQNVDIASFQLTQVGQTVDENSELTLSWNLDSAAFPANQSIDSINAVTEAGNCVDASGQPISIEGNLESRFPADVQSSSLSLPVPSITSVFVNQEGEASACQFDIRLEVSSGAQSAPTGVNEANIMRVNLTTLSAPQTVTVIGINE